MNTTITCTSCGIECQRRRISEATYVYQCPECDYGDRLIRLLPGALYELAVFATVELPKYAGGWVWRRLTSTAARLGVMTTTRASAPDTEPEADTT